MNHPEYILLKCLLICKEQVTTLLNYCCHEKYVKKQTNLTICCFIERLPSLARENQSSNLNRMDHIVREAYNIE